MPALPKKHWTVEEYLSFERGSDEKHEFIKGEIYLMTGGTGNHSLIASAVIGAFFAQLPDKKCVVYNSDMRVKINRRDYTYPDVSVVCAEPSYEDSSRDSLTNPTLIVEVLSPSTERYDRGKKFDLYRTLPSMQEYVLVAQDEPRIERYLRQNNGDWLFTAAVGIEATLMLPSVGCTLALVDVYRQVTFEEVESGADAPDLDA
jgi:Uma2 family endonuclease